MRRVAGLAAKWTGAATVASLAGTAAYCKYDEGAGRSATAILGFAGVGLRYAKHAYVTGASDEQLYASERSELHKREAVVARDILLRLRGYYIKLGQSLCATGILPSEYDEVFALFLDAVPPRDWLSEVKPVLLAELGIASIDEVFSSFETNPIGSASIGQAHCATLKDGTKVVVKIQYPDVERYFRLDFATLTFICKYSGVDYGYAIDDVMNGLAETFVDEFDYCAEARNLSECAANTLPLFGASIFIPAPIDATHRAARSLGRANGLCTRKVLTMELVPNATPIKSKIERLVEQEAKKEGLTAKEYKAKFTKMLEDPSQMREAMGGGLKSTLAFEVVITAMRVAGTLRNWFAALFNAVVASWVPGLQRIPRLELEIPLNGPRIARLLFAVHGHQIFGHAGFFNSDPHAGNVLAMVDGRLALIDYGACCRLSRPEQRAFARLIVAIADGDDDGTVAAFVALGAKTKNMDAHFLLGNAVLCFHRGAHPDDLKRLGIPENILLFDAHMAEYDSWERLPKPMLMLQRCGQVLQGITMMTGAGTVSCAEMWRDEAEMCLLRED